MKDKKFQFDYPVTDFGNNPALFVGNLGIRATAIIGREEQILKVEINGIVFFDGNVMGTNIKRIVKAIAPVTYSEICEAALQHIKEEYYQKQKAERKAQL